MQSASSYHVAVSNTKKAESFAYEFTSTSHTNKAMLKEQDH